MIWNWQTKQDLLSALYWCPVGEACARRHSVDRNGTSLRRTVKEEVTNDLKVKFYGHLQVHTLTLGVYYKNVYKLCCSKNTLFSSYCSTSIHPICACLFKAPHSWKAQSALIGQLWHRPEQAPPTVFSHQQSWLCWGRGWRQRLDSCDITTLLKSWQFVCRQTLRNKGSVHWKALGDESFPGSRVHL